MLKGDSKLAHHSEGLSCSIYQDLKVQNLWCIFRCSVGFFFFFVKELIDQGHRDEWIRMVIATN